ncbi:hypothetical protein [Paenibacillus ehimensis]|uniref:hypothetical protein n=1 Tax=Paenibacillus ehimensis TaxID=79264 RepID=UPI000FD97413|nr:hypothetical protein [Paenibacillus ehimensis]
MSIALEKKYKISSYDVGFIVSQGTRLAFEDMGYDEHALLFFENKFTNDLEQYTSELKSVTEMNQDLITLLIAESFSRKFLLSIGLNKTHEEWELKKVSLFVLASSVFVMVRETVDDFLRNVKIVDFK